MKKYAICYRGISFEENLVRNYNNTPTKIKVDFSDCIESNLNNLINPLKENNNQVDIFFNTYESKKLNEYIEKIKPCSLQISEYSPNIKQYNFIFVIQLIINSLKQIKDYQIKNNIKYDFIILTRFDLIIFQKFTEIYLPENSISTPTTEDDCFIVISGDLLDIALDTYLENQHQFISHHMVYQFLKKGIRYHKMFPHRGGTEEIECNLPFYRLHRLIYPPEGQKPEQGSYEDIFNKDSKYYGFRFDSHKEYTQASEKDIVRKS